MTPWHLSQRAKGYVEEQIAVSKRTLSGAWHGAYLDRVAAKNFPSLDKLLSPPEKSERTQGVDEAALKLAFELHNKRVRENGEAR